MTIQEAAHSTYPLFTAVLAAACRARYRAIASTERKGFAMFRNGLLHAFFSALGSSTTEGRMGVRRYARDALQQLELQGASLFWDCIFNGPGGAHRRELFAGGMAQTSRWHGAAGGPPGR